MASNFIPLDEAAKRLGIATDQLVDMRSRGEIRGFRDGASWKFPEAEIERLAAEMEDNQVLDDFSGGGSSVLISEDQVGSDPGREAKSKVIGGDRPAADAGGKGSDVGLGDETPGGVDGSDDFTLAPLDEADADELVLRADDSGHLDLAVEPRGGSSGALKGDLAGAAAKEGSGSKVDIDLSLEEEPLAGRDDQEDVLSGMDLMSAESGGTGNLIHGDSDPAILSGSGALGDLDDALSDDDELVIADDDDDLVLGGAGSDISVAGDSGINLMSPSDSGLSLESEPLDLAGSSISALDLGAELKPGSGTGSGPGSGSGSLVDFQADEDFQLSPSGVGLEVDDDSGSQVIEVDDSAAFGSGVDLAGEGVGTDDVFGADDALMADEAIVADESMGIDQMGIDPMARPAGTAPAPAYEVPFSLFNVLTLVGILMVMCVGGMLMTDLVRNMWAYTEPAAPVSSLTDALISMAGLGS